MSILNEVIVTYYDMEWGRRNGIAPKDVKDSLKMISEVAKETNNNIDIVENTFLNLYHNMK